MGRGAGTNSRAQHHKWNFILINMWDEIGSAKWMTHNSATGYERWTVTTAKATQHNNKRTTQSNGNRQNFTENRLMNKIAFSFVWCLRWSLFSRETRAIIFEKVAQKCGAACAHHSVVAYSLHSCFSIVFWQFRHNEMRAKVKPFPIPFSERKNSVHKYSNGISEWIRSEWRNKNIQTNNNCT